MIQKTAEPLDHVRLRGSAGTKLVHEAVLNWYPTQMDDRENPI